MVADNRHPRGAPGPVADPAGDPDEWEWAATPAADLRENTELVIPSRSDGIVRSATKLVGGPLGRHGVVGRARLTPLRVILALALVGLALGWSTKAGCLQQHSGSDGLSLDWDHHRQYIAMCYTDTVPLYSAERLDRGAFPYKLSWTESKAGGGEQQRFMEYPVITGLYMYGAMRVAKAWTWMHDNWGVPAALEVVLFFTVVAFGLALFWLVTVWATAILGGRRIWSTWLVALSPLVFVHIFTNFDAIATACLGVALLFWSRRNLWAAGVFIGLGTAAKLYPALALLVLLVLCLRTGKVREFAVTAVCAVATWLVVNVPVLALYPRGWWEFFRLNSDRNPDVTSLYRVVTEVSGYDWGAGGGSTPTLVNAISLALFVLVCLFVAFLGLRAPTRPRVAQLLFLLVAGFLLVNKVWSPQYSLWLVPLAVLAIPHARILLTWMTVDALTWIPLMGIFLPADARWLPPGWFFTFLVVRAVLVLGLCALVVFEIYRPEYDLVRNPEPGVRIADPIGGVLNDSQGETVRLRAGSWQRADTARASG